LKALDPAEKIYDSGKIAWNECFGGLAGFPAPVSLGAA
jgi:hypothetical protein